MLKSSKQGRFKYPLPLEVALYQTVREQADSLHLPPAMLQADLDQGLNNSGANRINFV